MLITGINPLAMAEQVESMKEAAGAAFQMYESLGMSASELEQTKKQFMEAMEYVTLLLPVVFLLSGMITAWLNFAVGGKVLRRLGHHVTTLPEFDDWHLPKAILYIFGFSLVGLYWGSTREIEILQQVSLNAYVLSTLAGFIQGTAVISSFARNRISRWLFWLIVLFFDYRKRFRRS